MNLVVLKCSFLMVVVAVLAAGCTHEVVLRDIDGQAIAQATLEFTNDSTGTATVSLGENLYRGVWTSQKVEEGGAIARHAGINSRKYQSWSLGRGSYLRRGQATLQSQQGDKLNCQFSYRGTMGRGSCLSDNREFDFVVEG